MKNETLRKQLRKQIESFTIGSEHDRLTFIKRLARENAWSVSFAKKAYAEYLRFIYMVSISDEQLTPSDEVDQVWHLHMTYTQSYWVDLCRHVLGVELHHKPTKGGNAEQSRYKQQYSDTLDFYLETFSAQPPSAIWPTVEKRFATADQFVRINKSRYWLLFKPENYLLKFSLLLSMPVLLAACTETLNGENIWFALKVMLGVYITYKVLKFIIKYARNGSGSGCGGSGCSGCGG